MEVSKNKLITEHKWSEKSVKQGDKIDALWQISNYYKKREGSENKNGKIEELENNLNI